MKSPIAFVAAILAFSVLSFTPLVHADDATAVPDTTDTTAQTDDVTDISVPTETVLIRDGGTVVYQGTVDLPAAGTIDVSDDTGAAHSINAQSVLGLLFAMDQGSDRFSVSDLQYFSSFGSLYLKCITPVDVSAACDNWQYVVNGLTPSSSMDATVLTGGETVGFYFGSPHQVSLDATSISAGGSITAIAQKYNYVDNTWSPLTGVTIGATVPNPADAYNPTVVTSAAVDANGSATLTLDTAGTYGVGIADDYYFPSYAVTVSPVSGGGGSGGGGDTPPPPVFSVPNALAYLSSVQGSDGSFGGSDLYSDWAGVALGAANSSGDPAAKLLAYMAAHPSPSSLLTDNERHAMALLALGQNPYSFHATDSITPIVHSFDGTQFGDPSLINDDIFALIPLSSAGYTASDDIITKDVAFVLSKQKPDGSWEESVDMTSAAVQALTPLASANGVSASLTQASGYLQNAQAGDGGFGSVYSTSWVAQAMSALGASWTKNAHSVADYFAAAQASDGAVLPSTETAENRIWATSYAIPAALGKPWSAIFHAVSRPAVVTTGSGGSSGSSSGSGAGDARADQSTIVTVEKSKIDLTKPVLAPEVLPTTEQSKIAETKMVTRPIVVASIAKAPIAAVIAEPKTEAPAIALAAAAASSGQGIPLPLVGGSVVAAVGLGFVARRLLTKKG